MLDDILPDEKNETSRSWAVFSSQNMILAKSIKTPIGIDECLSECRKLMKELKTGESKHMEYTINDEKWLIVIKRIDAYREFLSSKGFDIPLFSIVANLI